MRRMEFDANATLSAQNGIFGLVTSRESAKVILQPVPWEVTTSYGGGTAGGPEAILRASSQLDLFDLETGKAFEQGYFMLPIPHDLFERNQALRPDALEIRRQLESDGKLDAKGLLLQKEINLACGKMVNTIYQQTAQILADKKIPGVIGGDHSSPEGAIRAVSESVQGDFGILHIDAHADLRHAYQGFQHSHASIMYNVMHAAWRPKKLVQVGIRDFCHEEYDLIRSRKDIATYFDLEMKRELLAGTAWSLLCRQIVESLPKQVYISFDIDGLSPEFCPSTGTPVPGGLSFDQAVYLLGAVCKSGRRVVGFDLNEVAPGPTEWDGNVGARILYKLCGWAVLSQRGAF